MRSIAKMNVTQRQDKIRILKRSSALYLAEITIFYLFIETDLAMLTSKESQAMEYSSRVLNESMLGHAELNKNLFYRIFRDMKFDVDDEIIEALPIPRDSMNLDPAASATVTANMLKALSKRSL